MRSVFVSAVALVIVSSGLSVADQPLPFDRTELQFSGDLESGPRARCRDYRKNRQPLFGDLHDHTNYSIDAFTFDVRLTPRDAYRFTKGQEVTIEGTNPDGSPRKAKLTAPLDFAAVTDHSEGFSAADVCQHRQTSAEGQAPSTNPNDEMALAYNSPECQVLRAPPPFPARVKLLLLIAHVGTVPPTPFVSCDLPSVDCNAATVSVWNDIQQAAEEAYDRTMDGGQSNCSFTTFVAYEWTPMPGSANMHRNVIFRNERVPAKPISYYETQSVNVYELAPNLWRSLDRQCLKRDGGNLTETTGCDVMTIPHNMNLSAGLMFPDPADPRVEASFESVAEIIQHKGQSECRFDKFFMSGVDTTDELCAFEQLPAMTLLPLPGPYVVSVPPQVFPPRSFLRNVLKDGLKLEEQTGVNPFKLGFIGSTDTHQGTPGNTREKGWPGHVGNQDDSAIKRMSDGGAARANPGGLAVVWAEENSRDSIFEAIRRRETYGTSGTRPIVRFFGAPKTSGLANVCNAANLDDDKLAAAGYSKGVPMGGTLDGGGQPSFVVSVAKGIDGANLQRIQIVKGWLQDGETREKVYDAWTEPVATVDASCSEPTEGQAIVPCVAWSEPAEDFDPNQRAFYYARILEEPTCRWSTYDCQSLGIDPFDPQCLVQAVRASATIQQTQPTGTLQDCCRVDPVVQERAWTSPIWYNPQETPAS